MGEDACLQPGCLGALDGHPHELGNVNPQFEAQNFNAAKYNVHGYIAVIVVTLYGRITHAIPGQCGEENDQVSSLHRFHLCSLHRLPPSPSSSVPGNNIE